MTSIGKYTIRLFSIGIFLFFVSSLTFAQSSERTPEAAARNYWTALRSSDWAQCAALIHPKSLSEIRNRSTRFVDFLLDQDRSGFNLKNYFGVSNKADFEKLGDAVVFERLMRRMYILPGLTEILNATTFQTIGTIEEGDLAHIVYRTDVRFLDSEGNPLSTAKFERHNDFIGVVSEVKLHERDRDRVEVMSLRKDGTSWKILPGDEYDETLSLWEKEIRELQLNIQKVVDALSAGKNKSRRQPKPAPTVRRR